MGSSVTPAQKRKIKELVDEIVVNRGVLMIDNQQIQIDGMSMDQLGKLAFKYYKMIFSGKSPLDIDAHNEIQNLNQTVQSQNLKNCIGCNQTLENNDIEMRMPVCKGCRDKIRVDYDVLRDIFL